jgi:hypothetical protein
VVVAGAVVRVRVEGVLVVGLAGVVVVATRLEPPQAARPSAPSSATKGPGHFYIPGPRRSTTGEGNGAIGVQQGSAKVAAHLLSPRLSARAKRQSLPATR